MIKPIFWSTSVKAMTSGSDLYCDLYYKPMTIVNNDSRVINKLEASLSNNARVIIYDCYMFMVQDTDVIIFMAATETALW
jgi:hypothetical protein